MKHPFAEGKQLASRVLRVQLVVTLALPALALLLAQPARLTLGMFWGGLAVVAGNGVFALRHFARIDHAPRLLRRFFAAAALKWLVLFLVFGSGLVLLQLPGGALLAGLITAQLAGTWALLRYG